MTPEPLESDTVHVRWLPAEASDAVHLSRWRGMLDAEELARADRYHFVSDRDTWCGPEEWLRQGPNKRMAPNRRPKCRQT